MTTWCCCDRLAAVAASFAALADAGTPDDMSDTSDTPPANTSSQSTPAAKPKRAISVGQILAGILFVVVVVFVLENTRVVTVRLLFPEVRVSLALALVIAAVLGALIAALLRYRRTRRNK